MTTTRKSRGTPRRVDDRPRNRQRDDDRARAERDLEHATIGIRLRGSRIDDVESAPPPPPPPTAASDS